MCVCTCLHGLRDEDYAEWLNVSDIMSDGACVSPSMYSHVFRVDEYEERVNMHAPLADIQAFYSYVPVAGAAIVLHMLKEQLPHTHAQFW